MRKDQQKKDNPPKVTKVEPKPNSTSLFKAALSQTSKGKKSQPRQTSGQQESMQVDDSRKVSLIPIKGVFGTCS